MMGSYLLYTVLNNKNEKRRKISKYINKNLCNIITVKTRSFKFFYIFRIQ